MFAKGSSITLLCSSRSKTIFFIFNIFAKVSGQGDAAALLVGDWFTYTLDMDMPSIATNKKVEVEICTNPPDNGDQDSLVPGKTSLAIGNSSVIAIGDHFQGIWWQDEKEWLDVGGNQVKYLPSFQSGLMIMF